MTDVPFESRKDLDPRHRFKIDVKFTSLREMSKISWNAITKNNDPPTYFTTAAGMVRIVPPRHGNPTAVQAMGIDSLTGVSARTALWVKFTEKEGELEQFPMEKVMRDMLANPNPPLPRLARITRAPSYGPTGSLSVTPGFDPESGHYFADEGLNLKRPPGNPSDQDIAAAKRLLFDELLGDFPFVADRDRAHALSLMLNPFVRSMIDGPTPLYMIEAPSAGTGKSLLAHVLMIPALGAEPTLISPASNDEEMRKTITANLQRIPESMLLDNVSKEMKFPSLASVLTARVWTDRILGRSEVTSFPVQCSWIATANNPSMTREIYRRTVRIRMDAGQERPEDRDTFRIDRIERWARDRRADLVGACLILVNHWIAHGAVFGPGVLGSYDDWAGIHSGILEAAGIPGFLDRDAGDESIVASDEGILQSFIGAWFEQHRTSWVSASALVKVAQEVDGFYLGNSPNERSQTISLAKTLNANRDRIIAGFRILFRRRQNTGHYALQVADPTTPVEVVEVDLEE